MFSIGEKTTRFHEIDTRRWWHIQDSEDMFAFIFSSYFLVEIDVINNISKMTRELTCHSCLIFELLYHYRPIYIFLVRKVISFG